MIAHKDTYFWIEDSPYCEFCWTLKSDKPEPMLVYRQLTGEDEDDRVPFEELDYIPLYFCKDCLRAMLKMLEDKDGRDPYISDGEISKYSEEPTRGG